MFCCLVFKEIVRLYIKNIFISVTYMDSLNNFVNIKFIVYRFAFPFQSNYFFGLIAKTSKISYNFWGQCFVLKLHEAIVFKCTLLKYFNMKFLITGEKPQVVLNGTTRRGHVLFCLFYLRKEAWKKFVRLWFFIYFTFIFLIVLNSFIYFFLFSIFHIRLFSLSLKLFLYRESKWSNF